MPCVKGFGILVHREPCQREDAAEILVRPLLVSASDQIRSDAWVMQKISKRHHFRTRVADAEFGFERIFLGECKKAKAVEREVTLCGSDPLEGLGFGIALGRCGGKLKVPVRISPRIQSQDR